MHCFGTMYSDVACRAVPNKRGIAAATMAVGSTFGAFVRYLFGRWLPTFEQLMHSKVSTSRTSADSGWGTYMQRFHCLL